MIRPLAALAAMLVAAAAPHGAATPGAARHAATAKPRATVRVEIVSGTPQRVPAYVSHEESKYVTDYPRPLVVRITGVKDAKNAQHRVQFTCVGKDCGFGDPEQPESGNRTGPDNYSIIAKDGVASLHAAITHTHPSGAFTVYAEAVAKKGERTVKSKPFTLTTY